MTSDTRGIHSEYRMTAVWLIPDIQNTILSAQRTVGLGRLLQQPGVAPGEAKLLRFP